MKIFRISFGRTIRTRLLVAFVLIGVLPVFLAATGSVAAEIYNGRQQAHERLQSVAVSKETAIMNWMGSVSQELSLVLFSDNAFERINIVLSLASDQKYLNFYNKAVRNRLSSFVNQSTALMELFLVDINGDVVLSTDPTQEGSSVVGSEYFQQGLARPYVSLPFGDPSGYLVYQGQKIAVFSIPIFGPDGKKAGLLAGKASIDVLKNILQDQTGMGHTGKAYILSPNGFLNGSNVLDAVEGTQIAFQGRSSGIGVYKNDQAKTVIGVYRWLPDQRGVLFVEQEQREAIGTVLTTLGINLFIAVIALLVAITFSLLTRRNISRPLENLAKTATQIAAGDLHQAAPVEQEDEIGVLARAFNSMTEQLRLLIRDLEDRVKTRTQDLQRLALRLETNAQVGREITSILDIDLLLDKVTELIRDSFGYYGVHIYLLDSNSQKLVFRGDRRNPEPQNISVDFGPGSLNGEAASSNEALLVNDVTQDSRFLPDENYPLTQAELVVPLRVGNRVIGTLDLLNDQTNSFSTEDVLGARSLADQIAIAIDNAHLYKRSRTLAVLEERNRMAGQLHDSMNQSLYSVILFAGAGQQEMEKNNLPAVQHYLSRIEHMARQSLKEMRLMVFELRPKVLEQNGLAGALQQRLDTVELGAGLDARLVIEGDIDLPPETEEALYRIAQEALNNVLKHASASRVRVSLVCQDGELDLAITDDGVGFDPLHPPHKGIGLVNMNEQAAAVGATLQIRSSPGSGSCVQAHLNRTEITQ